jgi:hypothetical protein
LFVCLFLFLFYLKQMIAYVSRAMVVSQNIAIYMIAQIIKTMIHRNKNNDTKFSAPDVFLK